MPRNEIEVSAPVDAVWSVLSDARQYDRFVVGTKRVRRFDPTWPSLGAALHHTVGVGPVFVRDATRVAEPNPPAELRLHAGLGPGGTTEVVFRLEPAGEGATRVTLEEHPIAGAVRATWNPVFERLLSLRNAALLRRLRRIAEQRAATMAGATTPRRG